MIPCVDQYVTGDGQILASNLYVAMTRARSLLAIYGIREVSTASRTLTQTISECVAALNSSPSVEMPTSIQDDINDILDSIGQEHRKWLVDLWKRYDIRQEPLIDSEGKVIAEPLFWFKKDDAVFACFQTGRRNENGTASYYPFDIGQEI